MGDREKVNGAWNNAFSTKKLALSAVVGAAYLVLTIAFLPISFGPVQCRISEALCVLPFYFPSTAWGLFVGCFLSNLIGGYGVLDLVCGSLATLLAALCTARIGIKWLAPLPPVLWNGVIIGAMLAYVGSPANFWEAFGLYGAQVAAGELAACYILGLPLLLVLPKLSVFPALREKYR
ncbi:MAG: QueT transporter family protein [Oscillospiraceae bacterium]